MIPAGALTEELVAVDDDFDLPVVVRGPHRSRRNAGPVTVA